MGLNIVHMYCVSSLYYYLLLLQNHVILTHIYSFLYLNIHLEYHLYIQRIHVKRTT